MATNQDIYTIIEGWLRGEIEDEEMLQQSISEAEYAIRNFIGYWQEIIPDPLQPDVTELEPLPNGIKYVWARLSSDVYADYMAAVARLEGGSISTSSDAPIKSIKEGDTTITYAVSDQAAADIKASRSGLGDALVQYYAGELMNYRRLYRNVKEV